MKKTILTMLTALLFASGAWAQETFTFSWGTAGTAGYSYSQAGPTGGTLITNNAIYFLSNEGPRVDASKLNPYRVGFVFKPTANVCLKIKGSAGSSARTIQSIKIDKDIDSRFYELCKDAVGQSNTVMKYALDNASDDDKSFFATVGILKVSKGVYSVAGDAKSASGQTAQASLYSARVNANNISVPANGEKEEILNTGNSAENYIFEKNKYYRVYTEVSSSSGAQVVSFTFFAAEKYTVSFNAGSYGTCGTASLTEGSVGAGVTLPTVTPSSGYMFNGWYDAASAGTKVGDAGETYYPDENIILYAQYSKIYTVTYQSGEGSGSDVVITPATTIAECPNTFTAPAGKIFAGWKDGEDNPYAVGAMVTASVTLIAQWVSICEATLYNLVASKGAAEVTTATATVNEGTSLVLSNTAGRIKLTPQSGMKFKNGDKIDISGTVGVDCSKNDPKPFGIKIYASDGSTSAGTITYNDGEAICSTDGTVAASGTLTLASDQDYIFIARHGGTTTTLTSCEITRNIASEYPLAINGTYGWASFYIDVPVKVPANTTAYYASSVSYSTVEISPIVTNEVIPAYTGVIVSSTDATPTFTYDSGTPKSITTNKFKGCLVDTPVATETTYVLSPESTPGAGNCVFGLYMGTTLGANKAYMDASDRPSGSSAPGRIFFEIANENNATDINNIESSDKAMKIVENGQIFILRDGHKYDVMGRIVK